VGGTNRLGMGERKSACVTKNKGRGGYNQGRSHQWRPIGGEKDLPGATALGRKEKAKDHSPAVACQGYISITSWKAKRKKKGVPCVAWEEGKLGYRWGRIVGGCLHLGEDKKNIKPWSTSHEKSGNQKVAKKKAEGSSKLSSS